MQIVQDIRNSAHRLIGRYNPNADAMEILMDGFLTGLRVLPGGALEMLDLSVR